MKIVRPNMADIFRTFTGTSETDSKAPPETSIDVPASIMPMMEFCRPVALERPQSSTVPIDASTYLSFNASVAAGAASISAPQFTLRRGVWRIVVQGSQLIAGATAGNDTHAIIALVGPDGLFGPGLYLARHTIGTEAGNCDFLIHLPDDSFTISFELDDPVTALSVNLFRGSVYACHLL